MERENLEELNWKLQSSRRFSVMALQFTLTMLRWDFICSKPTETIHVSTWMGLNKAWTLRQSPRRVNMKMGCRNRGNRARTLQVGDQLGVRSPMTTPHHLISRRTWRRRVRARGRTRGEIWFPYFRYFSTSNPPLDPYAQELVNSKRPPRLWRYLTTGWEMIALCEVNCCGGLCEDS